jgi:hypothetical protein
MNTARSTIRILPCVAVVGLTIAAGPGIVAKTMGKDALSMHPWLSLPAAHG